MAAPSTLLGGDAYVPILRCKQAELGALTEIDAAALDRLLPLVELRDPSRQGKALAAAWPHTDAAVLVHPLNLDERDPDWCAAVRELFAELREMGVVAVPVATTGDAAELLAVVRDAVAAAGAGACVRIEGAALGRVARGSVAGYLRTLTRALGVTKAECDLVVDLGLVRTTCTARVIAAEAALSVVPTPTAWRNVVVAFSAFPGSVMDVAPTTSVATVDREDALAFAQLVAGALDRSPTYGDYALAAPDDADVTWPPVPVVSYAAGDRWHLHRADTRTNRRDQYVALCRDVVSSAHFAGADASPGDEYLADVAGGRVDPGGSLDYAQASTSRHLACVLERLARLGVP